MPVLLRNNQEYNNILKGSDQFFITHKKESGKKNTQSIREEKRKSVMVNGWKTGFSTGGIFSTVLNKTGTSSKMSIPLCGA